MKKALFILLAMVLTSVSLMAQDSLNVISDIVNTSVAILDYTGNKLVKGVPNSVVGSLVTAIVLGIVRIIEKRKLIKKLTQGKQKNEAQESVN